MKTARKLFTLLIALLMAVSVIAGCGTGTDAGSSPDASASAGSQQPGASNQPGASSQPGASNQPSGSGDTEQSSAPEEVDDVEYRDTIYIGMAGDLDSADPYMTSSETNGVLVGLTFDQLIRNDLLNDVLVPRLATQWRDVSGNATSWEVDLREGVVFHDGSAFTAEDVLFTYQRASNYESGVKTTISRPEMYKDVVILDTYKIRFDLNFMVPDFPYYLTWNINSKTAFETMEPEKAGIIGAGPYVFYSQTLGVDFRVKRFDDYWGQLPYTEWIVFLPIAEASTRLVALQTGQIDLMHGSINPVDRDVVLNDPNLVLHTGPSGHISYLGFNLRKEILSDLRVRKAIGMAINRENIVLICLDGKDGYAVNNMLSPAAQGYTEIEGVSFDPAGAKALLAEAGYPDGFTIHLQCYGAYRTHAALIQSDLKDVGITVVIDEIDSSQNRAILEQGQFDMFLNYLGVGTGTLLGVTVRMFNPTGGTNFFAYDSPAFNAAEDRANNAVTYDEMLDAFHDMQDIVGREIPAFPLYTAIFSCASSVELEGLHIIERSGMTDHRYLRIRK